MSFSSLRPLARALPRAAALRASVLQHTTRSTRSYATEAAAAAKGPNVLLYGGIAAAVVGAGAYFALSGDSTVSAADKKPDYQAIYNAIADILDAEDYDDGSYAPVLVRLSWHCSGTYDKETRTGGSNGATMRFTPESAHGANAGLDAARNKLEVIKARFPEISYSDLWTLAGVCAVQEMGGPYVQWRAGRSDAPGPEACTPDGRLPDGDKGNDHIRKIFYRMGFNDEEIVALSGAHAVGRCHSDRSGFDGPWTFSPTTFTNDYYKLLLDEKWSLRKWKGPIQYEDAKTKSIMMLTTDHALMTDKIFRKTTEVYAKDEPKFFKDFAVVFQKLHELGVPQEQLTEPIPLIKVEDQPKQKQ